VGQQARAEGCLCAPKGVGKVGGWTNLGYHEEGSQKTTLLMKENGYPGSQGWYAKVDRKFCRKGPERGGSKKPKGEGPKIVGGKGKGSGGGRDHTQGALPLARERHPLRASNEKSVKKKKEKEKGG